MSRKPPAAAPAINCSGTPDGLVTSPITIAATAAGKVILLGMIRCSKSITATGTRITTSTSPRAMSCAECLVSTTATASKVVTASTIG